MARDLGERLGCGALVETLRRERVGPFLADDAIGLDIEREAALACLQPLSAAVALLPRVTLDAENVFRLRQGQAVEMKEMPAMGTEFAVFDGGGALVGVGRLDRAAESLRAHKILATENRI